MNKSSSFRRFFGVLAAGALLVGLPLVAPAASAAPAGPSPEVTGELTAGEQGRARISATGQMPMAERYLICLPGHHQLRNQASSLVADVRDISHEPGALVQIWENVHGVNQQFRVCAFSDQPDQLIFIARHSNQCVDVAYYSREELAPIQQWPCHFGENQRFYLTKTIEGGYLIGTAHTNGDKYLGFMLRHGRFMGLEVLQTSYNQEVWLLEQA